ncbi:hypothetical Protein YC6258_01351 [Gynuella sunshinyii YC6258]|uniref:Uncharacterized protein n=1 Tax=Gynuella sunshinyii YC6258 TaxID=1445510 RepID=A0A0C5VSU9_9GAMM|nr:hypothetical Protein YC6258_01351 [Gynuella sunshinyii YC6258]
MSQAVTNARLIAQCKKARRRLLDAPLKNKTLQMFKGTIQTEQ